MKRNQNSYIQPWKTEFQMPLLVQSFKKKIHEILNERRHNEEFPSLFYFLPLTPDWKEKINQHKENVSLDPIDCSLDYLNSFSPDKEVSFRLDILNSDNAELRSPQIELLYQFFRQMAGTSNANIIPDADYLLATDNKNNTSIVWVGPA